MNDFNENDINRDASGKFASKTSGEPEHVELPTESARVELDERAVSELGYDVDAVSLTTNPDGSHTAVIDKYVDDFEALEETTYDGYSSDHEDLINAYVERAWGAELDNTIDWGETQRVSFSMPAMVESDADPSDQVAASVDGAVMLARPGTIGAYYAETRADDSTTLTQMRSFLDAADRRTAEYVASGGDDEAGFKRELSQDVRRLGTDVVHDDATTARIAARLNDTDMSDYVRSLKNGEATYTFDPDTARTLVVSRNEDVTSVSATVSTEVSGEISPKHFNAYLAQRFGDDFEDTIDVTVRANNEDFSEFDVEGTFSAPLDPNERTWTVGELSAHLSENSPIRTLESLDDDPQRTDDELSAFSRDALRGSPDRPQS